MDESFPGSPGPDAPPPYLGGSAPGAGQVSERMQSLLSRAVEDQMAEQRQLQLLVNDIRATLAQLQQDIRQLAGGQSTEAVRADITTLGGEVRGSSAQLGERLEAVVRAVTASVQAVQSVTAQLDRVHEQLNHQQQVLATLPATVQRAAAEATPTDNAIRDEMAALRAEIAQMRAATGELVRGEVGGLGHGVRSDVAALRNTIGSEVGGLGHEVRTEVAGLRDALGGELADVRALVEREIAAVRAATRADAEETARSVTTHVDTAVLALAEALLRRRGGGAVQPTPTPAYDEAAPPAADDSPDDDTGPPMSAAPDTGPESTYSGVTSAAAPRLAPAPSPAAPGANEPAAPVPAGDVAGDDLGHGLSDEAADAAESEFATSDSDEAQAEAAEVFDAIASDLDEEPDTTPDEPPGGFEVPAVAPPVGQAPAPAAEPAPWLTDVTPDVSTDDDGADVVFARVPASAGGQDARADDGAAEAEPAEDLAEAHQPAAAGATKGDEGEDEADDEAEDEVEDEVEDEAADRSAETRDAGDAGDDDAHLRWSAADDRPQAAFTMGRGWDTAEKPASETDEPADEAGDGRPERRRPWWRPGG
ncbi:MAG TPA: hypothetical protein VNA12_08695 [Mycobacteriales bacterium]|nr:hypothetical protein [Mycobacteriales bacterium]